MGKHQGRGGLSQGLFPMGGLDLATGGPHQLGRRWSRCTCVHEGLYRPGNRAPAVQRYLGCIWGFCLSKGAVTPRLCDLLEASCRRQRDRLATPGRSSRSALAPKTLACDANRILNSILARSRSCSRILHHRWMSLKSAIIDRTRTKAHSCRGEGFGVRRLGWAT